MLGTKRVSCNPLLLALLLAYSLPGLASQAPASPAGKDKPQLWAKLQCDFDSAKASAGDTIFARVVYDWVILDCTVSADSLIAGKVISIAPPARDSNRTEVSILFAAACMGGKRVPLNLIAVLYPVDNGKSQMDVYNSMPAGSKLDGVGGSHRVIAIDALPTPGVFPEVPKPVKVGQVTGIRHLEFGAAAGTGRDAALTTTDKSLRMARGTRLVFQMGTIMN